MRTHKTAVSAATHFHSVNKHRQAAAASRAAVAGYPRQDRFEPRAPAIKPAGADPKSELVPMLEQLLARLGGLLTSLRGGQAQPPASAPAPVGRPAGLAPTPLNPNVEGQIAKINTIKTPGVAPKSQFRAAVDAAIKQAQDQGLGVDPDDPDAITDFDAYHSGVVSALRARGYNAAHDGEELAVGRPGDNFSEQFDISTSTGRTRHFYAAWLSPPAWA